MIMKRLPIFILAIFLPWVALVFIVPAIALSIFNITGNQVLGYVGGLIGLVIFLIAWYKLSEYYLRRNLEKT